uniref:Uncharacterized protein n=1 Tax=Avena sativa TaxID=4498 RepID=A0ACD5XN46_AVESA
MPSIKEPVPSNSEDHEVVVAENWKMVDIQDKEVTMEGICSVAAYDQWTPLSVCGQPPKPRYKHGAAVVQEKMYVFGGNHNGRYLGDVQVLDFKSLSWSKLEAKIQPGPSESAEAVLVTPCAGHSLIPSGNKILSLAGHTREPTESLTVKEFDPQTCTWSTLRTYGRSPSSRGGQSVTRVGDTLVVFGGEGDGRSLLNDLHVLDLETMTWDEFESTGTPPSPSFRPSVSSNGLTPLSAEASSSRGAIFEIEELQDKRNNKGGDISKTLVQAVKHEKNQLEEKIEREKIQSFHLKTELADVENKNVELTNELQSVRDQLLDEAARASKLENEVSDIQQRLLKMATLEKEFELLRNIRDGRSDKSASGSNKKPGGGGFRRWYGDES